MILPDYWLMRPAMVIDDQTRAAFEDLLRSCTTSAGAGPIPYTLKAPRWQFLCYIAENHAVHLHGTGDPDIATFLPRQPSDLSPFGNQSAVFATSDGIWAMFYAVIDRTRYPMSINNACVRIADDTGAVGEPYYLFSISQEARIRQPWRTGFVYLLPAASFVPQPAQRVGPYELRVPQYASPVAVAPLARIEIAPDDFPFLSDVRGHDDDRLHEYIQAMQTMGPWPDS